MFTRTFRVDVIVLLRKSLYGPYEPDADTDAGELNL